MLTHCNTHTYATHVYTRAEAVGLLSTMPGMEHVDLGCVHENPVGPCFHEDIHHEVYGDECFH